MAQAVEKKGMARLKELAFYKKGLIFGAMLFSLLSVAVSFVPFVAIYLIIRELVPHLGDLSGLNTQLMITYGWVAGGAAVGAVVLNFIALMCSHFAAFKTLYHLKVEFTRHIASLPMGFHTKNSTGKLRKIVDENIEKLEGFIAHQLPDIVGSFASPLVILCILMWFDWRLGLASLVPLILSYAIVMIAYRGDGIKYHMKKFQSSLEELNNASVEYVRGISVLKAFNQTIFSFRKFYDIIKNYTDYVRHYTNIFENYMGGFLTVINNVYLFLMPVIILVAGGAGDYPRFAMSALFYLIFSFSVSGPFTKLMYISGNMAQIADSIERMDNILNTPPLSEPTAPKEVDSHDVTFDNVSFCYGQEEEDAIKGVSFTAKQGEITALVGASGSGKSTIAHLIPRFYDVQQGAITIGGVDIREMDSDYLMDQVSFVFQDVFLFKQSIKDNILVGNKDASAQQVIAAAKAAQCHDFIMQLPQGYDTVIGTKSVHLSGGEKQRIVIARAILKDAPIIVLDEATAFADPENEQKIQLAFEQLIQNKTVIIIAHRLSTIRGANKIVVLDGGSIVEQGVHGNLIEGGGQYKRLWDNYVSAIDWKIGGEATC